MRGVTAKLTDTQLGSHTHHNQKRRINIKENPSNVSMKGVTDKLTVNQLDGHFMIK